MLGIAPAGAALAAPIIQAPASGSTNDVNPELQWGSVAGAAGYRVQVATSPAFSSLLYQADTAVTRHIPSADLDAGALHWRVAALSGGVPQAWAASSFVKSATLGMPTQTSPADGATTAYPAATVLSWTAVASAGAYDLHITGSSTINDEPFRVPTTSFSAQLADEPITWRVRAVSTNGRTVGPWSATRSVEAVWDSVPSIQSPPDGGFPIRDAWLAWDPLPGARQYELEVTPVPADWTSDRTVRVTTELPAHRFLDPNVSGGGAYAWRVRGRAVDGMVTAWTPVRTFEIELSQPPELLAPADGAVATDYPLLRWTPVQRASHYEVDVSTDATFATDVTSIRTTEPELVASVASPVALDLASGGTYYWRVRPIDDPGGKMASAPSAVRSFTFSPPAITQLSPGNQEFVTVPTLSWEPGWGSRYRVTVRDAGIVVYVAETVATTHTPTALLAPGGQSWRVEALAADGDVVNTSDWRTVVIQDLEATDTEPEITLADGFTDWVPPTITWTPVVDAVAYDVRYECDPPTCSTLNPEPLAYPAYTYEGDSLGRGRFDYEIVAYDVDGAVLAVSEPRHFVWTTPPLAEVLPIDGCDAICSVHDTPLLSWNPVHRAERYVLSIFRDGEPIADADHATFATSFRPTADLRDGSFTWRVRACAVERCSGLLPAASEEGSFEKSVPAPALADPADAFEFTDLVVLGWDDWLEAPNPAGGHASEAKTYAVTGAGTAANASGEDATMTVFMTNSPSIEWRVQAIYDIGFGHGFQSPSSETRSATIRRPAPIVLGPPDDAQHDYVPMLSWQPRALARSYEVELYRGDGSDLSEEALVWRAASHPRTAWTGNEYGAGTYAWRVRANLGPAGTSDWSALRTFEIRSESVSLVAPSSGGSLLQSALTFAWEPLDRAEAYRVELSPSATFASGVTSVVTSQSRWIPTATLAPGSWFWRVTPLSASAESLGPPASGAFTITAPPTSAPTPTPTASPVTTPPPVPSTTPPATRVSGADRYATAAAVSARSFAPGVSVAYIATGASFPDALAAGPAAARDRGPVLLVSGGSVPGATLNELKRLKPSRIVVLGGTSVIGPSVVAALSKVAPVSRIGGVDRYDTAARLSRTFAPGVPVAYIAVGTNFPDALAGVPATRGRGPLLLVSPSGIPSPVAAELSRLKPKQIVVLGGTSVVSSATFAALDTYTTGITRRAGANRYETAVDISRGAFASATVAYVAVGSTFPDALAGGPPAAIAGAPMLLVSRGSVPAAVAAELLRLGVDRVVVLGGPAAISDSVVAQLNDLLD
jgi:putative cell wall-binding protein